MGLILGARMADVFGSIAYSKAVVVTLEQDANSTSFLERRDFVPS